jgi:TolB-like protein
MGVGVAESDGKKQTTSARSGTPDVFVSYASPDSTVAEIVCAALERVGVSCWIAPRDVTPGASYAGQIIHAIDAAKTIVLILSQNAGSSPHVLREVERAASKRHPIVSLRIDQAPLPDDFEYFLNTSHWLDASNGDTARAIPKLVSAVQLAIQTPVVTPVSTPTEHTVAPSTKAPQKNRAAIVVASLIGLAIAGFAIDRLWISSRRAAPNSVPTAAIPVPAPAPAAPAISEKSVAVLPFVDMSEKHDQEYFSDGLSEELIDMLTKVPGLRVPARTSSFYFKDKQTKISDIARELGVAHVLEGSVRKAGNNLRITAQLIRVDTGYHVWSETYDRKLDDIFRVQDEIATAVVKELKISLIGGDVRHVSATRDAEAYTLYLQGRMLYRRATSKAEYDGAAEHLRKALRVDPKFAAAWAFLAFVLSDEVINGVVAGEVVDEEMRRATESALVLDPKLAYAHSALATVYWALDWNWRAALAEYQRAYELDPADSANARVLADAMFTLGGDTETVLGLYEHAIDLDPVLDANYLHLATFLYGVGRLPGAEAAARRGIQLNPKASGVHMWLGQILLQRGEPAKALGEFEREPDEGARRQGLALAFHALGRRSEADAALAEVERTNATTGQYWIAQIHAYRGEIDQAFVWLERAYGQRDFALVIMNRDPLLKNLRADQRYKAFLRKMNLPE